MNHQPHKNALVTGASSGLGRAMTEQLAARDYRVFALGRNTERLESLSNPADSHDRVAPLACDLRSSQEIERTIIHIRSACEHLDLLVHNAAIGFFGTIDQHSPETMHDVIKTNLLAPMHLTRGLIGQIMKSTNPQIVFVSSLAGKIGFSNLSAYSASKFGIEGYASALREELGPKAHVMVAHPGIMDTNFFETAGMNGYKEKKEKVIQSPADVARDIIDALDSKRKEITVGPDRWFKPFLQFLPENAARRILYRFF